jgi:hypothetical protein
VAFIFVSAENATEDKSTVVIHVGLKVIDDSIGMPKSDIGKRKRENKSTVRLKDDDVGNFGKKVRKRKTTSTIEKKQAKL